jgi:hypothetical protein
MPCHLSTIPAPFAADLHQCGVVVVRVHGTVHLNTYIVFVPFAPMLFSEAFSNSVLQDWSRHRKECIPAVSTSQNGYNVNMIATPPPAEPQYITVSAILFSPEEGQLSVIIIFPFPP